MLRASNTSSRHPVSTEELYRRILSIVPSVPNTLEPRFRLQVLEQPRIWVFASLHSGHPHLLCPRICSTHSSIRQYWYDQEGSKNLGAFIQWLQDSEIIPQRNSPISAC